MRVRILLMVLFFGSLPSLGQVGSGLELADFISRLSTGAQMPETIRSGRSVILYAPQLDSKELTIIHESFNRIGIDAVAYFETDRVFAGAEVVRRFTDYFKSRQISNIVVISKNPVYQILITRFNETIIPAGQQPAWESSNQKLDQMLQDVYRVAAGSFELENHLINDFPEKNLPVGIFGPNQRRFENYAYDLKSDMVAVPGFGDSVLDNRLAQILNEYPFRYQIVQSPFTEDELRRRGFSLIFYFVHSRIPVAKSLLGYTVNPAERATVAITFPGQEPQLRTLPNSTTVYKYYVKQLVNGNVYLGTQWDGDTTWEQALLNQIRGLRKELGVRD